MNQFQRMYAINFVISSVALISFAVVGWAQQPKVGYVFPPVVQAGTTTEVAFGGYDFTADMQFFVHDQRVTFSKLGAPGEFFVPPPPYWFGEKGFSTAFPIPREIPGHISVPADMPAGLVRWQVANANGASPTGVFLVSRTAEMLESRRRDDQILDLPALPVAVSGRLRKISEVDRYRVIAKEAGPITVDLMARRLGSDFNGVIEIRDASGKRIKDVADTEGLDAQVTFAAEAGAAYTISLADADFRGNRAYVYRLSVTAKARVVTTSPARVGRGELPEVDFVVDTGGKQLERIRRRPTESDALLGTPSDVLELSETDAVGGQLPVPCGVTGLFAGDATDHRFSFAAVKGECWRIEVMSRAIGGSLDVSLAVSDATGKVLATNDDLPGTLDAGLDLTVPQNGIYQCRIDDMAGRSRGPDAIYRLSILRQLPDFSLSAPQQVIVPIGGKSQLAVKATRRAGFAGEIKLRLEGLPEGVTVADGLAIPAGKNDLKIPFEANQDAASIGALVRVIGSAMIDDIEREHAAMALSAGNLCPRSPAENQTTSILLATTMKAPVTIDVVDKNRQRAVHCGTTYPAPMVITRAAGFEGEVILQMAATQSRHRQGIQGPIMTVPAGDSAALYPCFMPEWLATDRTTRMIVMGMVQVPDPRGNMRWLMARADARITMILEGALLKVAHRAKDLTIQAGQSFDLPLEISRSVKLSEVVRVELEVPEALRQWISADVLTIAPDEQFPVLRVQVASGCDIDGDWDLIVKAHALQAGKWRVMSQTEVPVRFSQPLTLPSTASAP